MSLILSGTDGLSDVDGTAATPAIRGTDANTGIFFGTDIIGFSEGGVEAARINADSQFVAAAGTAALPVITTTGDTNTGIFFPAADTIAFAEGGAECARFDSSGNFGLGVTPSAWQVNNRALQIYEGWASISGNNSQGCCDVSANCFNTGSAAITGWKYTNSSALASLYQQSAGVHKWLTAPSGTAGNAITFTQAMTLDASGNLGVGTTSPSFKIDAIGSTTNGSGIVTTLRLKNGGASANDGAKILFTAGTSTDGAGIGSGGQALDSADLRFYAGGNTERARIDTSGNLMVGTTSQILSNTKFNFSSSQGVALGGMGFVNTVAPSIKWQIGPDNAGNFVIFNGSAVGVYIANGATAWTAYSDERLKTTIIPFENAAAKVATLRAGTGRYLKDAEGTSRSFLIAQDVQKILPEAVDANNPDALGLSYTDVIPLLVAAINEQQALITTLTARITALESA